MVFEKKKKEKKGTGPGGEEEKKRANKCKGERMKEVEIK